MYGPKDAGPTNMWKGWAPGFFFDSMLKVVFQKDTVFGPMIFCSFQVEQVHDFFGSPPLPTEDTGEKCLGRRMYMCASGIMCGMNKEPFLW